MSEIIKEGKLYDVEFHCDICGCVFKKSVRLCDNVIETTNLFCDFKVFTKHSCQCPCCNTWINARIER